MRDSRYTMLSEKYGMTPEEYTYKFLDTIDIAKYLNKCGTISDVVVEIETDYKDILQSRDDNDIFEDFVFNWILEEEFIEYIYNRYGNAYSILEEIKIVNRIYKNS